MWRCDECSTEGRSDAEAWFEVRGWTRPRTEGGANHIALAERTGATLCGSCMALRKSGIHRSQVSLNTVGGSK